MFERLGSALLLLLLAGQASAENLAQIHLPRALLHIRQQPIEAQLATTPKQRNIGLMHRTQMPQNEGMLFIYTDDAERCFWMRDTPLPLSAAFIDKTGVIVKLVSMQPFSDKSHCSEQPVRYVLEMQQGWFKKHEITTGERVNGIP
ncbi:hypothetical protein AXE65_02630 [Ventosimonas gracilis]|uniref:DUF192 domain-containing protein n=1 Tax=Ventosimonas gracilis TaxID=1680762 RepID=A0A139SU76_9GAMM|nr:DUF192 domain-containing protein [Ventosimonas gracilis]KXU38139.1 hypothetical protein AXE65_02630 [Ventosimonas gracilis]